MKFIYRDNSEVDNDNIRPFPNIATPSDAMRETTGALMTNRNSSSIRQDNLGRGNFFGVPIQTLGSDRLKIKDNVFYGLTAEVHETLSSLGRTGNKMTRNADVLMFNDIIND